MFLICRVFVQFSKIVNLSLAVNNIVQTEHHTNHQLVVLSVLWFGEVRPLTIDKFNKRSLWIDDKLKTTQVLFHGYGYVTVKLFNIKTLCKPIIRKNALRGLVLWFYQGSIILTFYSYWILKYVDWPSRITHKCKS